MPNVPTNDRMQAAADMVSATLAGEGLKETHCPKAVLSEQAKVTEIAITLAFLQGVAAGRRLK